MYRPLMIGIGVNTWVWTSPFTAKSVELIARAQTFGFDSITLPVEAPDAIDGAAVERALRDTELRVHVAGAFGPTRDLTHDDPRVREAVTAGEPIRLVLPAFPAKSANPQKTLGPLPDLGMRVEDLEDA